MITMNPSSPASVAAAEAAATAAGALATSSIGGRCGGFSLQRRHGFPAKRAACGGAGATAAHAGPSRRPSTASAANIALCPQKNRRRTPTSGGARGLYGEDASEFWGGGGGDNCGGGGGNTGGLFGVLGTEGNGPTGGTALTDPSLGANRWETLGTGGGGQQDARREPRIGDFVLDLDGRRRGYASCGGGGLADDGVWGSEIVTPFQRWKNDKGITSPGVAETFAGHGCGS